MAQAQHEVGLGAVRGPVKAGLGLRRSGEQLFNHKPFPTGAGHRVTQYRLKTRQAQQGMGDATVAHLHLGRAHQPLAHIAMPGRQTTDQHQITQDIDIARHRLPAHGKRC